MGKVEIWHSTIDAIIPCPDTAQVLLLAGDDGWRLPRIQLEHDGEFELCQLAGDLQRRLGITTTVLRQLGGQSDEERRREHLAYALENHSPGWEPPTGGRWVGRDALTELPLAFPAQRTLIEAWLDEAEHGAVPALRAPWARPGWFEGAGAWIAQQLAQAGTPPIAPVEQVSTWCLSCILRARTAGDTVYFKAAATLPLFAPEPAIVARLSQWYPDHIPMPLGLDSQRRWMLLHDFGPAVGHDAPPAARETLLQVFGAIQRESAARVEELLAIGCVDRRLERLRGQLDALLQDTAVLSTLDDAEVARFRALRPRLHAHCERLAGFPIPQTLGHGDLHLGNVANRAGTYLFFDWTDACVVHPFLDMLTVYYERDAALQAHLRDSYLALWTAYAPIEQLREAWELARPLCDLHQAVSYQSILNNVEAAERKDFVGIFTRLVRAILQVLADEVAPK